MLGVAWWRVAETALMRPILDLRGLTIYDTASTTACTCCLYAG